MKHTFGTNTISRNKESVKKRRDQGKTRINKLYHKFEEDHEDIREYLPDAQEILEELKNKLMTGFKPTDLPSDIIKKSYLGAVALKKLLYKIPL